MVYSLERDRENTNDRIVVVYCSDRTVYIQVSTVVPVEVLSGKRVQRETNDSYVFIAVITQIYIQHEGVYPQRVCPLGRRCRTPWVGHNVITCFATKQKQLEPSSAPVPQLLATLKSGNAQIMSCSETTEWGRAALIWSDPHLCCRRTQIGRHRFTQRQRNNARQASGGKCMRPPRLAMAGRCGLSRPPMGTTRSWSTHRPQHWPWPECVLLRCTTRFAIWQTFIWLQ